MSSTKSTPTQRETESELIREEFQYHLGSLERSSRQFEKKIKPLKKARPSFATAELRDQARKEAEAMEADLREHLEAMEREDAFGPEDDEEAASDFEFVADIVEQMVGMKGGFDPDRGPKSTSPKNQTLKTKIQTQTGTKTQTGSPL